MDLFPENIYKSYPLKITERWKTIVNEMDNGVEHRVKKWAFPKREIGLTHKNIKHEEIKELWKFYNKQGGSFKTFGFFYPVSQSWVNEFIAYGDGNTTTFDLKSKNTSNIVVYKNGVVVDSADYSVSYGNGTNGVDTITFTSAPADGDVLTYDFDGNLYLKVRFKEDFLNSEMIHYLIYNSQITLVEVEK